jgi:prolyl-tRNA synthetase
MGKKKSTEYIKGIKSKKNDDFSEWFTEVNKEAELADLRYNIKGFLVFQPWSVLAMEKMYKHLEKALQKKGHKPYLFPTLIPEENLKKESTHVKGFTPEVFWVTQGGGKKFNEKYALRPTSETAFYQMFSLWIRSHKDLPFKTYQRANIFRYDTKATRPFLRSREFYWIETHCAHATEADALKQVREDMATTKEVLHDIFGLPFIFFERPHWDKFPGASRTFAADVLNPDGKFVQQPSTHMISQDFAKAFNVKFKDKDGKEKHVYLTCYGPAISRIFASVAIVHGDDKGLKFPWEIAPVQIMIIPIGKDKPLIKKAEELKKKILELDVVDEIGGVDIDLSDKSPGEKFNYWEMKGVPIRIDLGIKELKEKKLTVFRRDLDKKELIKESVLLKYIEKVAKETTVNLANKADKLFSGKIKKAKGIKDIEKVIKEEGIAQCHFCSTGKEGVKCAEVIEKKLGAEVRGTRLGDKSSTGRCSLCGKKANDIVYIAKSY